MLMGFSCPAWCRIPGTDVTISICRYRPYLSSMPVVACSQKGKDQQTTGNTHLYQVWAQAGQAPASD